MARRPTRQVNSRYVSGNLAHDYDYLEREQRRRTERERQEREERRERTAAPRPRPRERVEAPPRHRERVHVSNLAVLGFIAAAAMTVALLMSYAQLAAISNEVVKQQKELSTLQAEHVELVARYERTFDLAAIKEAAEAAGMAKPSASQIYYIDLSAPDNVVLYQRAETGVLSRVLTSVGQDAAAVLEYFK